jgi:hypothetical protein
MSTILMMLGGGDDEVQNHFFFQNASLEAFSDVFDVRFVKCVFFSSKKIFKLMYQFPKENLLNLMDY